MFINTLRITVLFIIATVCFSNFAVGQSNSFTLESSIPLHLDAEEFKNDVNKKKTNYLLNFDRLTDTYFRGSKRKLPQQSKKAKPEKTTSLTVGYIPNKFNLLTDDGNDKYRYFGELTGIMLGSNSSSLTLTYGNADAENGGDIRSISADLRVGGNATLFSDFFGLPLRAYIPIRVNFGYRNLELQEPQNSDSKNSLNLGKAGIGAGLGSQIRIPTGLPLLEDNLVSFVSIMGSVGGFGDLSSDSDDPFDDQQNSTIKGIRLSRNIDLNIEGKFENLLGDTGVTVGFTYRLQSWTRDAADNFGDVIDVATGEHGGLELRGKQTFFRLGINW
jgi:hypothetical protein